MAELDPRIQKLAFDAMGTDKVHKLVDKLKADARPPAVCKPGEDKVMAHDEAALQKAVEEAVRQGLHKMKLPGTKTDIATASRIAIEMSTEGTTLTRNCR